MKNRFHSIENLLSEAYSKKESGKTKSLAFEYLSLANQFKNDWNYGNAIHQANLFLGLTEFDNGNIEEAKKYLIKAGHTPGSPQLNSFGPNMLLAKKMLENGETKVVLEYINLCKKYWHFWFRVFHLRRWKKEINKGLIPNFGAHLIYHLNKPKRAN